MMKHVFFAVCLTFGFVSFSKAQGDTNVAKAQTKTELVRAKETGVFVFEIPGRTDADIQKSSKYYTHYFTVDFDEGTHTATVTMVENNKENRVVIARFLISSGMRQVMVDTEKFTINQFKDTYLL